MRNSGLRTGTSRPAAVVTTAALCAVMALGLAPQPGHAQQANTTGSTAAIPGADSGVTPADDTAGTTGTGTGTGTGTTGAGTGSTGASTNSEPSPDTAAPATADPSKVSANSGALQEAKDSDTWNGATDPQKAPLVIPGGAIDGKLYPKLFHDKFTDTATPRSLLHWDVELKEDERVAFSYVVPPKDGIQRVDSSLQIIPFIIDQEGHNCVAQKSTDQEDNTNFAAPFTGYISSPRVGTQDQECKPGKYKVSLERRGAIEPSMELPFDFMLWKVPRAAEEPAATASTSPTPTMDNPTVALTMAGERKDAKLVEPGNYSGTLEPNKLQWFKVLVSEGQRLHLDVNASPIELERNADTSQPISLEWRILGPTFNPVVTRSTSDSVPYDNVSVSSRQAVGIETATNPIQWTNLEKDEGSGVGEFLSGEQWIALRYYRPQAAATTQPLKFNIAVAVSGTPLSVPKFVDNLTGQAAVEAKRQETVAEETQPKTLPRFMVRSNTTPGQLWTWAMVAAVAASIGAVGGVGILRGRGKEVSLFK